MAVAHAPPVSDTSWDARTKRMMSRLPGPVPRQGRGGADLSAASHRSITRSLSPVGIGRDAKQTLPQKRSIQVAAFVGGLLSLMNTDLAPTIVPTELIEAGYTLTHAALGSSEIRLMFGAFVTVLLWEASSKCTSPRSASAASAAVGHNRCSDASSQDWQCGRPAQLSQIGLQQQQRQRQQQQQQQHGSLSPLVDLPKSQRSQRKLLKPPTDSSLRNDAPCVHTKPRRVLETLSLASRRTNCVV